MKHFCKTVVFVAFVALLFTAGRAFTQTPSAEESSKSAALPATVAHVYVQTHQGVDVYDATAASKLTLVKGSPFPITGQMGGINGKYLISVGSTYLRSYVIEANGAVGKQVSIIDPESYGGGQCGVTNYNPGNGVTLDHTGKYFYFPLSESDACDAMQSYEIESNGRLLFLGDIEYSSFVNGNAWPSSPFTISSNDKFAYGTFFDPDTFSFSTFARAANGVLEVNERFAEKDPTVNPDGTADGPWVYYPVYGPLQAADPASHMAVLLGTESGGYDAANNGPYQLASYTIDDTTGAISSTNTWEDMPTPAVSGFLSMSISGKLLAVSGGGNQQGMQLFHFNGAAPITPYTGLLLPDAYIQQIAWDSENHMYAMCDWTGDDLTAGQLHVFNATPSSVTEAAGSPYRIANAYGVQGLIVVPQP